MQYVVAVVLCLFAANAWGASLKQEEPKAEVCFDKYGCFNSESPWTSLLRPLSALPKAPWLVGTRFLLFSRDTVEPQGYELMPDKDAILAFSKYNAARKTVFILHGFTDNHRDDWAWDVKNNLLRVEDLNIISVDWAPGAKAPYLNAVGNSRMVGAQMAHMISYLERKANMRMEDVHVIAHSVGAHAAGYVGDRLLGRLPHITAIDPMDPYFGGTDQIVRLDTNDARFVEVIHGNGNGALNLGLGIVESIGHADIFPNGGRSQPGCNDILGSLVGSIIDLILLNFEGAIGRWACSHVRATKFYAESIAHQCPYASFQCGSMSDYNGGKCYTTCTQSGKCTTIGYNSRNYTHARGNYFLKTADGKDNKPYCMYAVRVDIPIGLSQQDATGNVKVTFRLPDGSRSDTYTVFDGRMSAGQVLSTWVELPMSALPTADTKLPLILRYTRGGLLPTTQPRYLNLASVNVNVLNNDLQMQNNQYGGVTLEAATDTQISD